MVSLVASKLTFTDIGAVWQSSVGSANLVDIPAGVTTPTKPPQVSTVGAPTGTNVGTTPANVVAARAVAATTPSNFVADTTFSLTKKQIIALAADIRSDPTRFYRL